MINYLLSNNILTSLIWEPDSIEGKGSHYLLWLNKIRRTHSQLVYTTVDGGLLKAYSERKFSDLEPFAIHVRNEFGDGIYYFTASDEGADVYFIIISDNRIVSGSDRVVTRSFFDRLISEFPDGIFSGLAITELKQSWIESVSELCRQRQIVIKRKQKLFIIGVAVAGTVLLVIMAVLLNMMLS